MKIPAKLYKVLAEESDRLLDRLCEAVALDFTDARDNGQAPKPSPDVTHAVSEAQDEFDRLVEMLRDAGGRRYLGNYTPLAKDGASLSVVLNRAMPLCRKITNLLRQAEPDFS